MAGQSGERNLVSVSRSFAVCRIGSDIVGDAGRQTGQAAGESSGSGTVDGLAVCNRGILRCAPANASRRYGRPAVRNNLAAGIGGSLSDGIGGIR